MKLRFTLAGILTAALVAAQTGTPVNISQGPAATAFQAIYGYSGTNQIYACYSPSSLGAGPRAEVLTSISAATNANPVVFTSTAHGFNANTRPSITISGGTGNWAAVNGTFIATVTSANAFSIPVDSTTFGAVTGTLVYTTTAPRTNKFEWAVVLYSYDGSNNLINRTWLNGSSGLQARCSDATSATLAAQ
jgi:hypothetical protein